jgi:hypothetical protein
MDTTHLSIRADGAVVALDEEVGSIPNDARLDGRDIEADLGGEAHHESLVFGRGRKTGDRRLQDVRRRLARRRQRHRAIHENDRHFRLRPGERKPEPLLAREQGAAGDRPSPREWSGRSAAGRKREMNHATDVHRLLGS